MLDLSKVAVGLFKEGNWDWIGRVDLTVYPLIRLLAVRSFYGYG